MTSHRSVGNRDPLNASLRGQWPGRAAEQHAATLAQHAHRARPGSGALLGLKMPQLRQGWREDGEASLWPWFEHPQVVGHICLPPKPGYVCRGRMIVVVAEC